MKDQLQDIEEKRVWSLVSTILSVARKQKPPPGRMLTACVVLAAEISVKNKQSRRELVRLVKREWDHRKSLVEDGP